MKKIILSLVVVLFMVMFPGVNVYAGSKVSYWLKISLEERETPVVLMEEMGKRIFQVSMYGKSSNVEGSYVEESHHVRIVSNKWSRLFLYCYEGPSENDKAVHDWLEGFYRVHDELMRDVGRLKRLASR